MSSMRTTLPTGLNQNDWLNFRLVTTRRTPSPNMPTITWRHTTSSCLTKSSKPLLLKTFTNYFPTKTKLISRWMTPTKRSSLSTGWNRTNASPPSMSTLWRAIQIQMSQRQTPMWLLSDHNNHNNSGCSSPDTTIQGTIPEDKTPTKATPTTDQHRIKATTQHEMVNSVYTARS